MATAFNNVGMGQMGQDMSFSGGEGKGLGQFLIGAALASMGVPPQLTSSITKNEPIAPPNSIMQGSMPTAAIPGQPMQNPEDERTSFSKGFGSLFSHLPTFGK
jgi:hypothetical protein